MSKTQRGAIVIRGARQNNLKNLTLELPHNELTVVTGVSGSGKSSLVFDTLYAEGQRRYVETFSPYARQFLDRQDRPQVDSIDGIPPAIAIDQTNPVRTSRSTVGTMTELNDHLKLLYARATQLYCRACGAPVRRDSSQSIVDDVVRRARDADDPRLIIAFPVEVPKNFSLDEIKNLLAAQGYTRFLSESPQRCEVIQDRLRAGSAERARLAEAVEAALRVGQGRINVFPQAEGAETNHQSRITRRGASPRRYTARTATSITRTRCPACSPSTRRWAPATPAAVSAASSASISVWWYPMRR